MVCDDVEVADSGFNIAKILGILGVKLEIASFTKGQNQLSAGDVEDTYVIWNVIIHIEKVIGNIRKKCSILVNGTLPIYYFLSKGDGTKKMTALDKIVLTVFAVTNLCPSVVPLE